MKKKLSVFLAGIMLVLSACTGGAGAKGEEQPAGSSDTGAESVSESLTEEGKEGLGTIKLGGLKGPTSMGLVKLIDDAGKGSLSYSVEFDMEASPDLMTPKLLNGEADIAALPVNVGSVLYNNSKGKVKMIGINTLGILYILQKGEPDISTVEDLKGKTIVATGQGATPEYTLSYILSSHNIDISKDVTMDWKASADEALAAIETADNAVIMLPQPYVTVASMKMENLNTVLDLTKEWDALGTDSRLVTAGLFVRSDFLESKRQLVEAFLADYTSCVEWINTNTDEAAQLVEANDIIKAPVAAKAIPYCNLVSVTGEDMKKAAAGYLETLYGLNPKSVGGELPGDDFYYLGN